MRGCFSLMTGCLNRERTSYAGRSGGKFFLTNLGIGQRFRTGDQEDANFKVGVNLPVTSTCSISSSGKG